jgi:hypothetical protein
MNANFTLAAISARRKRVVRMLLVIAIAASLLVCLGCSRLQPPQEGTWSNFSDTKAKVTKNETDAAAYGQESEKD